MTMRSSADRPERTIRSRVSGYLQELHFEDGQMVKKGELLSTANATPDTSTRLFALRQRQDQMFGLG